jgi:HlyD family secretion protein
MRARRSWILWGVGIALGVVAIAALLRPEPVEVEWAVAQVGRFRVTLEADGVARSRSRHVVTAPVTGRLERLVLRAGDAVERGSVVARVAPPPIDAATLEQLKARLDAADARVAQARTASAQAFRDLSRARMVEEAGGLSRHELESASLLAEARAAELRAAEAELSAAAAAARAGGPRGAVVPVRSPVRGQVLRVPEVSERVTTAGTPILEVGNATDLEVVADLLSTDAVRVSPGMPVELDGWGGEEEMPMLARVRLVEPVATTRVSALGVDEQRVNVVLDFVTPCETLGDGYRLTTRFVLWEGERVLSVPSSAVFREGDAWKLFVARDGRARTLAIGRRSEAAVEVRSGVAAGDTVVLFPSDRVVEGMKLQLRH